MPSIIYNDAHILHRILAVKDAEIADEYRERLKLSDTYRSIIVFPEQVLRHHLLYGVWAEAKNDSTTFCIGAGINAFNKPHLGFGDDLVQSIEDILSVECRTDTHYLLSIVSDTDCRIFRHLTLFSDYDEALAFLKNQVDDQFANIKTRAT